MSLGYIDSSAFTNIADAIRQKKGTANSMTPSQMPEEIATITTGNAQWVEGGVNFVDWDGKLLYSYTLEQAHNLTELPPLPNNYKDYTAYSWTEDLAFVKALTVPWMVGAEYTTERLSTKIYITVSADCLEVVWNSKNAFSGTRYEVINWGDGSSEEQISKGSAYTHTHHTYASPGDYTITVWDINNDGTIIYPWSGYFNTSGAENYVYPVIMTLEEYNLRGMIPTGRGTIRTSLINSVEFGTGFYLQGFPFSGNINLKKILIPASPSKSTSTYNSFSGGWPFEWSGLENIICPNEMYNLPLLNNSVSLVKAVFPYNKIISTSLSNKYDGCNSLEHINWWPVLVDSSKQGTSMDNTFYNCPRIHEKLNIPYGITSLIYTFRGIGTDYVPIGLKIDGNIPSTVTDAQNLFGSSSIYGEITFDPTNITRWDYFVYSSPGITAVHILSTTPVALGQYTFGYTGTNPMQTPLIYVPYSADHSVLNAYKTAWATYADYIFEEPAT